MKLIISMKTPNALELALDAVPEEEREAVQELADQFFEYEEYVHIELDTVAQTCTVLKSA